MDRRGFLGAILLAASAPAIVRVASLMPVIGSKLIIPARGTIYTGSYPKLLWPGVKDAWDKAWTEAPAAYKYSWFSDESVPRAIAAGWEVIPSSPIPHGLKLLQLQIKNEDFYES